MIDWDFYLFSNLAVAIFLSAFVFLTLSITILIIFRRVTSLAWLDHGDNEQNYIDEETLSDPTNIDDILQNLDSTERQLYLQAQEWIAQHPEKAPDISLSQYLTIQEKGVSAWEFEPDIELTNNFVEARTEVIFFDSESCVQTNLPLPKQNDVYYWEAKLFELPNTTTVAIGLAVKPYPPFRLPGWHKHSIAYFSDGTRRISKPYSRMAYGMQFRQGDVIGVGFFPRTGNIFFTHNGAKHSEAYLPPQLTLFPTVGAKGLCTIHINLGQAGFVFLDANIKKWGLASTVGTLGAPPAYGVEQGSILLVSNVRKSAHDYPNQISSKECQDNRSGRGRKSFVLFQDENESLTQSSQPPVSKEPPAYDPFSDRSSPDSDV